MLRQWRATGDLSPLPRSGGKRWTRKGRIQRRWSFELRGFLMPPVGALNAGLEFRGVWKDGMWSESDEDGASSMTVPSMQETALPDRLTVIAIAVIAYAGANITHEIIGHCGTAALLGNRCLMISSTYIPRAIEPVAWKDHVIIAAGSTANWAVGLVCFGILRAWRRGRPAPRCFLWLSMCVNLFLASTYVTMAPIIKFGDSYILIHELPRQLFWRSALALAGACICWLSFRLCRAEFVRLTGFGGRAARGVAWELVAPAYVAGGVLTVTSGLFSQLEFKVAQLEAAGGTFGLTAWLLLLPLSIPKSPATTAEPPFVVPRSIGWIVAGALVGLTFIGVLGPGISL